MKIPLTDNQQALAAFISAALIATSIATVPANQPTLTIILAALGAVGFGIKEALGTQKSDSTQAKPS